MPHDIRILAAGDEGVLASVAPGVFDNPVDPDLANEFLVDPHHHIAAAIDGGVVVGFASGVDYIHPDKPREFWINEVGVAPTHRGRGLGKSVLRALLEHARALGCREAWVLTETDNEAANALYAALGGKTMTREQRGYAFRLDRKPA
jgi:ribosomal protein S18 acetylase RimI-like enzyme